MTLPPAPRHANGSRLATAADHDLLRLEAETRHAQDRYRIYRAKTYGPRATDPSHLRELERASQMAEQRLRRVRADRAATIKANEGAP
jgi:hypothetical protein